jgi:hypothetical protein
MSIFAYLDPGSGSMVLQLALAGLLSSAFFLKATFASACQKFERLFRRGEARREG